MNALSAVIDILKSNYPSALPSPFASSSSSSASAVDPSLATDPEDPAAADPNTLAGVDPDPLSTESAGGSASGLASPGNPYARNTPASPAYMPLIFCMIR